MNELSMTKEYIAALEARDPDVLSHVAKSYGRLMKAVGRNLQMSCEDTEECVNDALLKLWNTIPPSKPSSIRSYVCRLMRCAVVDRIRYNSATKRDGTVSIDTEFELADGIDVEQSVIDGICLPELLGAFLDSQTPKNRELFIRRYYEFEGTKTIAADLFMSEPAVRKRLSRMREELKNMLGKWGYEL